MWFRHKKRTQDFDRKEAQIQAARRETFKKIDEATQSTRKLGKLLEDKSIAELIYKATGAGRR